MQIRTRYMLLLDDPRQLLGGRWQGEQKTQYNLRSPVSTCTLEFVQGRHSTIQQSDLPVLSVSTGNRSAVLIWLVCKGIRLSSGSPILSWGWLPQLYLSGNTRGWLRLVYYLDLSLNKGLSKVALSISDIKC